MVNLVCALVLGLQGSVLADPRLTLPLSFDDSLEPISQFAEKVSAATGVMVRIDPSLEYLKIDAFLEAQPAGVTLSKMAEAFDLEWQSDGNGYKLIQDKAKGKQVISYLDDEDRLVNLVVDRDIRVYRLINDLIPQTNTAWPTNVNRFENWKPKRDSAKADLDSAKANGVSGQGLLDLEIQYEALDKIAQGTPNLELARLFGQMSPAAIAEYRQGIPFIASNSNQARYRYSYGDIRPNPALPQDNAIQSVLITRIDSSSKRVGSKELSYLGQSNATQAEPSSHYPFNEIAPGLAKKPFAQRLKDWDQTRTLSRTLTDKINPDSDFIVGFKSSWFGNRFRLGDHLRWFHLVTGVPIIAPADRTTHPFINSFRRVNTQGEYISTLLSACGGFSRKSDDFLLVRNGVYWRKSLDEIPESVYALLEKRGRNSLTLKDYANFATKISRSQAMVVQDAKGFVVRFPRYSFAEAYPALQFVDSLNGEQMTLAKSKLGLAFPLLSPNQRSLFQDCVIEGVIDRGFVSETMLGNLIRDGLRQETLQSMLFHVTTFNITTIYESEVAVEENKSIELLPKRTLPQRPTVSFDFGYDRERRITFTTEDF